MTQGSAGPHIRYLVKLLVSTLAIWLGCEDIAKLVWQPQGTGLGDLNTLCMSQQDALLLICKVVCAGRGTCLLYQQHQSEDDTGKKESSSC